MRESARPFRGFVSFRGPVGSDQGVSEARFRESLTVFPVCLRESVRPFRGLRRPLGTRFRESLRVSQSVFINLRGPNRESVRSFWGGVTAAEFSFQGVLEGRPCLF